MKCDFYSQSFLALGCTILLLGWDRLWLIVVGLGSCGGCTLAFCWPLLLPLFWLYLQARLLVRSESKVSNGPFLCSLPHWDNFFCAVELVSKIFYLCLVFMSFLTSPGDLKAAMASCEHWIILVARNQWFKMSEFAKQKLNSLLKWKTDSHGSFGY